MSVEQKSPLTAPEFGLAKELNTPYHEAYHALAVIGWGQILGIDLYPEFIIVRSPESRLSNAHWLGQICIALPVDKQWGEPHPLLVGAIAAASLLQYQGGVKPKGIADDVEKINRALVNFFGRESFEVNRQLLLTLAHEGIKQAVGPFGHCLIDALAAILTPKDGEDVIVSGEELRAFIEDKVRLYQSSAIQGELILLNEDILTSDQKKAESITTITSNLDSNTARVWVIEYPDRVDILAEDKRVCPLCLGKNPFCCCSSAEAILKEADRQVIMEVTS